MAYFEYVVQGFEWDVVDYLFKFFDFLRFFKVINRVCNCQLLVILQEKSGVDIYFFVKEGWDLVKLKIDDIFFIKGQKDYV